MTTHNLSKSTLAVDMYSEYCMFICSLSRAFPSAFCIDGRVAACSKRFEHYILKKKAQYGHC